MKFTWHIKQVPLGIDQLVNTVFGGWADESLSARSYRLRGQTGWYCMMLFINTIFFSPLHCKEAYQSERERLQVPPEYRTGEDR